MKGNTMMAKEYILENESVFIAFEKENGKIVSIRNKQTGTELISEPRLADNFRLLVPLAGYLANYVIGAEQKMSSCEIGDNKAILGWNRLRTTQGELDIDVKMQVQLNMQDLEVRLHIKNNSAYVVEEAWYPILSGIQGIGDPRSTILVTPLREGGIHKNILKDLPINQLGCQDIPNFSYPYPCRHFIYPWGLIMQWIDLHNGKEGIYIGSHDPTCQVTGFHLERHPGVDSPSKMIPKSVPVGIHLSVSKHPFISPGGNWNSPPVLLSLHEGDWHRGADKYRKWALGWMKLPKRPGWVKDFVGWQHTIVNFQSDIILYKFKDIPNMAQVAKKYGIDCINIVGFHKGGIERGYPDFSPDPRLGTPGELKQAIKQAHDIGVKVILFTKAHRAEKATSWYKKELKKYAVKDRDGNVLGATYGYDTLDGIMGQRGQLAVMCPSVEAFRKIMMTQLKNIIELGADGIQLDQIETCTLLCYDKTHQHNPGQALPSGMLTLVREMKELTSKTNPNFILSGEDTWDALYQYLDVGYSRYRGEIDFARIYKYTFPEFVQTVLVDAYDYDQVNKSLLLGHALDFEINRWRGTLDMARDLALYAKEIIRLRKELSAYLLYGRFQDTIGAKVEGKVDYAVHRDQKGDSLATVVVNSKDEKEKVSFSVKDFQEGTIYRPFQKEQTSSMPITFVLEGHQAAVIVTS